MNFEDVVQSVKRLRLRKGDVLVVTTRCRVPPATIDRLRAGMEGVVAMTQAVGAKVVVVEDIDLCVLQGDSGDDP